MKILTERGFKPFDGFISQGYVRKLIRLTFSNNEILDCTFDHKLLLINNKFSKSRDLEINDILYGNIKLLNKEIIEQKTEVFDALEVKNTNSYWTNSVISHNCMLLDEFAFISSGVFEDFIQSVYPTISSSKKAKIIMISTPWGLNHFYKFWTEAEKGLNGYSYFNIEWNDVPGRDDVWRKKMISEIGADRFRQEFNSEFIGSSNTLINTGKLRNMIYSDPIENQLEGKFKIFEKISKESKYVLFCDVAEGVGGDASTIQVIDVTKLPYTQVAVFEDNLIKTNIFASVINTIGNAYNNSLVVVENNSIGETVLTCLNFDHEYDNLFFNNKKFGLRMTKGSKRIGCGHLKTFIETDKLLINDFDTIKQFTQFEKKKNGTFSAEKNKHDDLVTPFILFSMFMANDQFVEYWLETDTTISTIYSKAMEEIENNLLPIGFFPEEMEKEDENSYYYRDYK